MSEDYRFALVADAVGDADEPTLISERLDQIRERARLGTVREAMADRDFLLAEVDRLQGDLYQHALANGGCVPKPAYDELADECRLAAWETLTRLAEDHRFCDCTGSFPCEVRRVADAFGVEFCAVPEPVQRHFLRGRDA